MPAEEVDPKDSVNRWPELKTLMRRFVTKHRVGTDDIESEEDQRDRLRRSKGVEAQYRNGMAAGGYKTALDQMRSRQEKYHDYTQMAADAAISGGLDIYADEASQQEAITRHTITVESEDERVTEELEKFLFQVLRIDDDTWDIIRRLCTNGDVVYEIRFRKDFKGVYGIHRLDHQKIDRIEEDHKLLGFRVREMNYDPKKLNSSNGWGTSSVMGGSDKHEAISLSPFRVVHWRLPDQSDSIYGRSILEPARRTWRQVRLMEDSIVIYRISRGAERRVFYINVGNLAEDEAEGYIKNLMAKFKKRPFVNPRTNEIDERANPLAWDEDFFVPIQDNKDNTRIEQLPGGQNMGEIEDLKYFRSKIDQELKIPTSYLSRDGQFDTKAGLSQQDIRFSRTIERIQRAFLEGLNKLCYLHLMLRGYNFREITGFTLKMTPPSALGELLRLDALSAKLEIVGTARSTEVLPDIWILTEIMGFGEDEANELLQVMAEQKQAAARAEAAAAASAGGGAGGLGGPGGGPAPIPGAEGDLGGGEAPEAGEQPQGVEASPGVPASGTAQPQGIELASAQDRRRPIVESSASTAFYRQAVATWLMRRRQQKTMSERRLERHTNFEHQLHDGNFEGLDIKVGGKSLNGLVVESLNKTNLVIESLNKTNQLIAGPRYEASEQA